MIGAARRPGATRAHRGDEGFTLLELLIVSVIIPVVVGAMTLALLSTFGLQSNVSDRLGTSSDAQVVSANFYRDVQSATMFTTNSTPSSPSLCGATSQLLGLEWAATATSHTVISYGVVPNGVVTSLGVHEDNLERFQCTWTNGSSPVLTNTSILSFNVPGALVAAVAGQSCSTTCTTGTWITGWTSATGIQSISFVVNEAASVAKNADAHCPAGIAFCYTVVAAPRNWVKLSSGQPATPPSGIVPAEFLGSAGVNLASCNSNNPNLDINGQMILDSGSPPTVTGTKINIYPGSVSYYNPGGSPADIAGSPPISSIAQPAPDPLKNLPAPDMSGLPTNPPTQTIGGITYAYPGIYTTPLSGNLTLTSGVYELRAGISGNITSGVGGDLLYVTGGSVSPTGMQLWPMTTGPYAGITIWQGPAVSSGLGYDTNALDSGPGPTQIDGIIYAPGAGFNWHGNASLWVGALLTASLKCNGGGNGELNVGFNQTITFTSTAPASASVGGHYTVAATGGASGNPVTFSIDNLSTAGACSISGNVVTFTGVGTCLVDANQAQSDQSGGGVGGYTEAPTVQQVIPVGS
ncbi:MAG: prepilin-type N-terminal cleavage/methylation domain-containing protein [Acidimicrobiales bacterium]